MPKPILDRKWLMEEFARCRREVAKWPRWARNVEIPVHLHNKPKPKVGL